MPAPPPGRTAAVPPPGGPPAVAAGDVPALDPPAAQEQHDRRPAPAPATAPATATATANDPVRAAGALCWRLRDHRLEVLLVHRPRYGDWSFPKGKLEPGEHTVPAALREVAEETGLRVVLGRPLPAARYVLGGSGAPGQGGEKGDKVVKTVAYWASAVHVDRLPRPPRPREVDRTAWFAVDEAQRRLTRRGDQVQLRALQALHQDAALDTWPLVVVRHGHARPTTVWAHDEADRPLVASGRREAQQLAPLLAAWAPARVVSSPWERCLQTVRPFVEASGTRLVTKGRLTESAHRRDPDKVARYVGHLVDKGRPVVLCTHRPVLGTVLGALAGRAAGGTGAAASIPAGDPFLAPGEALVAHVSRRSGRVVAVERHSPLP
ncbi:NUDIX domain-containing protein [Pseudokineococcus basanitobsidens]|uniref:NUDIX domain-containing protein n=1 Tax=Pseudokineococcus basanitobsidens TaxID=1926649 RepID=A0ABU8RNM9_9ACTN